MLLKAKLVWWSVCVRGIKFYHFKNKIMINNSDTNREQNHWCWKNIHDQICEQNLY